jgi:excisionase family DNA binding protein
MNTKLLTVEEVASFLCVSTRTVRRYIARGNLRAIRASRRTIRVRSADLDAFLEKNEVADVARALPF